MSQVMEGLHMSNEGDERHIRGQRWDEEVGGVKYGSTMGKKGSRCGIRAKDEGGKGRRGKKGVAGVKNGRRIT